MPPLSRAVNAQTLLSVSPHPLPTPQHLPLRSADIFSAMVRSARRCHKGASVCAVQPAMGWAFRGEL